MAHNRWSSYLHTSVFFRFFEKELGWRQCSFLEQINGDFVIFLIEIVVWTPIFSHKISGSTILILVASIWRQAIFFWNTFTMSLAKTIIFIRKTGNSC